MKGIQSDEVAGVTPIALADKGGKCGGVHVAWNRLRNKEPADDTAGSVGVPGDVNV